MGRGQGHVTYFKFWRHQWYLWNGWTAYCINRYTKFELLNLPITKIGLLLGVVCHRRL